MLKEEAFKNILWKIYQVFNDTLGVRLLLMLTLGNKLLSYVNLEVSFPHTDLPSKTFHLGHKEFQ